MSPEPLVDLQRRLAEAGRIRAGVRTPKGHPKSIDTWRLTSPQRHVIEEAAEHWGGKVEPWKSPVGDEWQVITQTDTLPVLLMPSYSLRHSYEHWAGPSKCERRCDGITEQLTGTECVCNSRGFKGEVCDLHTRLTVVLPDLTTLLGWRLETQGGNAARELAAGLDLVNAIAVGRAFVPAKLLLTERKGQQDGQATRYVVPVIDLAVGYTQLMEGEGLKELSHTPAPVRQISTQRALEAVNEEPKPPKPRKRAAEPIVDADDDELDADDEPEVIDATPEPIVDDDDDDDDDLDNEDSTGDTPVDASAESSGESATPAAGASDDGSDDASAEAPTNESPVINPGDRARFFGKMRGAGLNDQQIKSIVEQHLGTPSTAKMTIDEMNAIMNEAGVE